MDIDLLDNVFIGSKAASADGPRPCGTLASLLVSGVITRFYSSLTFVRTIKEPPRLSAISV